MIKDILTEESATLDMIYQLRNQIADEETKREKYECQLWTETNFSKLGLSNADQRKAYVKSEMSNFINNISKLKTDLNYAEGQLKQIRMKEKLILQYGLDVLEE